MESQTTIEQQLQAQIDELRLEIRSLQEEKAAPEVSSRRHLLKNLGLAAAGAVAGTVAAGSSADAATGDELILGQDNSADTTTILRGSGTGSVLQVLEAGASEAVGLGVLEAVADGNHRWAIGGVVTATPDGIDLDEFPMGVVGLVNLDVPGIGIVGSGTYGGAFQAPRAHLVLVPWSNRDDAVAHHVGEYFQAVDSLWACVAEGEPGVWRKVAGEATAGQLHVITPQRIYDSRAGQEPLDVAKGVLEDEAERVVDATHGDAVPASVNGGTPTAALVNVTITDTTSTGGYLALFENGTTWSGNSTINWDAIGGAAANTTVVALDADGTFKVRSSPGGGTDFAIDLLGYWL